MVYLRFYVNKDQYIIDTRHIISVIPLLVLHKSAGFSHRNPPGLCGYIHYQNQTIPVVDLNKLLSGKESKPYLSTRIVLTDYMLNENRRGLVGLMVEKATEVIKLNEDNFDRSAVTNSDSAPYMGPVAKNSEGLMQKLHVNELIELKVLNCIHEHAKEIE